MLRNPASAWVTQRLPWQAESGTYPAGWPYVLLGRQVLFRRLMTQQWSYLDRQDAFSAFQEEMQALYGDAIGDFLFLVTTW